VKEVAHEGLRMVLTHQNRLPKELLQTGLRPILMNLADAKRLSIPGLEGLARLLELLTNYFKVEIGHKLLDHFRSVADPQMLQASSRLPLSENEGITKLVRLANIFHLLPSAANQFLSNLVNNIVQTEAQLHFSGPSPFSEPLAKFLDRYPVDAFEFFMQHLHLPRHVQTFRSILQAKLAPHLQNEIASRTTMFVTHCLKGSDRNLVLSTLMLFNDLAAVSTTWIAENEFVIETLLDLWRADPQVLEQAGTPTAEILQRHRLILSIFTTALQQSPRVDLIFSLMTAFTRNLAIDLVQTTQFLYQHIAFSTDLIFRRNVLMRFLTWFEDRSVPWAEKMYFIRLVLTPTLLAHAHSERKGGLLDIDFVHCIHRFIWPTINEDLIPASSDMFKIDLLHLTTVMVHHYHELLEDVKKDVIRCAWHYINSEDLGVKQTAYLLAARFFEAYSTPQKFILRAWTGLLRPPHTEGRLLTQQALDILVLALPRSSVNEPGYPHWAKTTLRLLAEEGNGFSQIRIIYGLIVRHPQLFCPVRALFIPHMLNSLWKLGLSPMATFETRLLSIEVVQVIYDWEQQASAQDSPGSQVSNDPHKPSSAWARETIISYLLRLATLPRPESKNEHEQQQRQAVHRVFALLQTLVSAPGWSDVTVKLHFFSRALEQVS
jgi:transformation/transcription domain-associated protein